jgi:hypothetical protein
MTKVLMLASVLCSQPLGFQRKIRRQRATPVTTQLPSTLVQCKDAYRAQLATLRLPPPLARRI